MHLPEFLSESKQVAVARRGSPLASILSGVVNDRIVVVAVALGRRKDGDRSDIYRIAATLFLSGRTP